MGILNFPISPTSLSSQLGKEERKDFFFLKQQLRECFYLGNQTQKVSFLILLNFRDNLEFVLKYMKYKICGEKHGIFSSKEH